MSCSMRAKLKLIEVLSWSIHQLLRRYDNWSSAHTGDTTERKTLSR